MLKKIAIVDDSALVLHLLSDQLNKSGFMVDIYDDPVVALDRISADESQYGLVLTDYRMPIMNGIQLCKALRDAGCKTVPIFIASGSIEECLSETIKQGAEGSFNGYFCKPFDFVALIEAIMRCTGLK